MFTLLITGFMMAQCPKPIVENRTSTWNKTDEQTLTRAKNRCSYYYAESPCLKRLIKLEENRYHAICGNANNLYPEFGESYD